jgi:hypothetical protein
MTGGAERASWRTHGQAAPGNAHRSRPAPPAIPAEGPGTPQDPLLTIEEVTAELRVSRAAFYRGAGREPGRRSCGCRAARGSGAARSPGGYAHCIDGQADAANQRIADGLGAGDDEEAGEQAS